jgi:hypothetical protein
MAESVMLSAPGFSEHYHQQKLLTRPEVHKMSRLDELISETLSRSDIGDSEKYDLYNAALADFRKVQHDVLRHGTMLTPSPNIFPPEVSTTSQDSLITNDVLKTMAELLQKVQKTTANVKSESTQDTVSSSKKPGKKASTTTTESLADKLGKELRRVGNFQKDLDKVFIDNQTGVFDQDLWKKTLSFMTRKRLDLKKVPSDVLEKAENVYNFMMSNKMDASSWSKNFPLFQSIGSRYNVGKRSVSKKKGHGMNVFVDWESWNENVKKMKKK